MVKNGKETSGTLWEDLSTFFVTGDNRHKKDCGTHYFILTVVCIATVFRKHIVGFPLQQSLLGGGGGRSRHIVMFT